jgi:hypothetical protein
LFRDSLTTLLAGGPSLSFPFLSSSYDLLLIIDFFNYSAILSLRFFKGKHPFSCFTLPDSISTVPRASGPLFKFCAPELVFSSTEGVRSRFHVLRSRAHFWRYGGRRVTISCFALPDSFSTVPRASVPVFMFCAPGLVFGGNEGVGTRFHILRSQTRFRWYRGRRVQFSCFARVSVRLIYSQIFESFRGVILL